jgi:hypothetical protein
MVSVNRIHISKLAMPGRKYDRHFRPMLADMPRKSEAGHPGHRLVGNDDIDDTLLSRISSARSQGTSHAPLMAREPLNTGAQQAWTMMLTGHTPRGALALGHAFC